MMRSGVWVFLSVALLSLVGAASVASAATLDVLQQSRNIFKDVDGVGGSIRGKTSYWSNGRQRNRTLLAGGFQLQSRATGTNDPYQDFLAFCVELTTTIRTSDTSAITYEEDPDLFDPTRRALVATLFQEAYDPEGSIRHQGAFQLALWKLSHGDVSQPGGDGFDIRASSALSPGVFSLVRGSNGSLLSGTFESRSAGVFDQAQNWLDQLDGLGNDWQLIGRAEDHVTFLRGAGTQNLVRASSGPAPIPLPGAALLSGGALATLLILRGRRRG